MKHAGERENFFYLPPLYDLAKALVFIFTHLLLMASDCFVITIIIVPSFPCKMMYIFKIQVMEIIH